MRRKHADLIHAWAEGAEIEINKLLIALGETINTSFSDDFECRIKPQPKPDVVRYYHVDRLGFPIGHLEQHKGWIEQYKNTNLKLTLDGETGKLKSAEVLE